MPRTRIPIAGRRTVGKSTARDGGAVKNPTMPLPHERDQSTRLKDHPVEKVIDQARKDVESGQQNTDLREHAAEVFDRRWTGRKNRS